MIGRRALIRIVALAGTSPVLAVPMASSSTTRPNAASPDQSSPRLRAGGTDVTGVAFKIDGWESYGDVATGNRQVTSIDSATPATPAQEVWISVNNSWRAAWR
jgi:hypothetical protein